MANCEWRILGGMAGCTMQLAGGGDGCIRMRLGRCFADGRGAGMGLFATQYFVFALIETNHEVSAGAEEDEKYGEQDSKPFEEGEEVRQVDQPIQGNGIG